MPLPRKRLAAVGFALALGCSGAEAATAPDQIPLCCRSPSGRPARR